MVSVKFEANGLDADKLAVFQSIRSIDLIFFLLVMIGIGMGIVT
jgi:hypothetical protein